LIPQSTEGLAAGTRGTFDRDDRQVLTALVPLCLAVGLLVMGGIGAACTSAPKTTPLPVVTPGGTAGPSSLSSPAVAPSRTAVSDVRVPATAASTGGPAGAVARGRAVSGSQDVPAAKQSEWARTRLAAIEEIYRPSAQGRAWMESYDFRQMVGQPAWFGSTGFDGYSGAGQAIPRIIIHELSHSMWGAFPIAGRPDLSGRRGPDGVLDVVAAYRQDLAAFLRQAPDRYEPLRDRFRNMPNLVRGDYPDLYHFGEADLIEMTGADLDLVPPILRKYVQSFYGPAGLGGRDFKDWPDALGWWNGLSADDRRIAGELFGLPHFPLERWSSLRSPSGAGLPPQLTRVYQREEQQRLIDFASQLDLVKERESGAADATGINRGFEFWRGYLNEMRDLHKRYPGVLRATGAREAQAIAEALDFYISIEGLDATTQVDRYRVSISTPYVTDFPFLLKSRALVELFAQGQDAQADPGTLELVGGYARRLSRIVRLADSVLVASATGPQAGAARLEAVFGELSDAEVKSELGILLDILRESDRAATASAMRGMSDAAVGRLLELRPEIARSGEIPPARLLAAAGVTRTATRADLITGIRRLVGSSSGNFAIDRPHNLAIYALLNERSAADPDAVLEVFAETGLPVAEWIKEYPGPAGVLFARSPINGARTLVRASTLRHPLPYLVRSLTLADPKVAARVLVELGRLELAAVEAPVAGGGLDRVPVAPIVPRALNVMAFDAYWLSLGAGPPVDIGASAALLSNLARLEGVAWLEGHLREAIVITVFETDSGQVDPGSYVNLIASLRMVANALPATDPAYAVILRLTAP